MRPLAKRDPESIGGYTLIGRLGAGGMGVVYLASKGSESVAIKVVRDSLIEDDAQLARFKREIETLESINHPNIARILDSGVDGEQAWFAAEFANGPDLSARVADKGPLDEDEWWTLAEGLMSALAAVHAAGVIHRDVKPSNVILTEAGPKLIDFGIAHVSDATSVTSTGMVAGSPAWFSPEQIEGFDLTPATDVFSAGSVLTLAATGSSPWGDETTMTKASVFKILTNEPNIDALEGVKGDFVGRLLEKEPGERPSALSAASAAQARSLPPLVPDGKMSGQVTRVVKRDSLAPPPPAALSSSPSSVTRQYGVPSSPEPRRQGRARGRTIAAVLTPLALVIGFFGVQQSEGTGDVRVLVRVSSANPVVGEGSLTIGSDSQNPVELAFSEAKSWPGVMRWSSWESLRVVYEPPFEGDEAYSSEIRLADVGLNGFNANAELLYEVVLQEDSAVLQLVNRSSDSVLHSVRLKRGNEQKALSECQEETSIALDRVMAEHRSLYDDYEGHRETARLVFEDEVYLRYTTWRSRMANLVSLMETDAASLPATAAFPEELERLAIEIEEDHGRLVQSYRSHIDLAAVLDRQGRSDTSEWQDSWDSIDAAERELRSSINAADASEAGQICAEQIQ